MGKGEGASVDDLATSLDEASSMVRDALAELRELARGIHPAVLTESGLAGAVRALATGSPVEVVVEAVPADRLPPDVEAAAYFFVSEALANVAKHAPAATARVSLRAEPGSLVVDVADDGPGGAHADGGSGLVGLGDRVAAVGGTLHIDSPPGRGTRLRARFPLPLAPGPQ